MINIKFTDLKIFLFILIFMFNFQGKYLEASTLNSNSFSEKLWFQKIINAENYSQKIKDYKYNEIRKSKVLKFKKTKKLKKIKKIKQRDLKLRLLKRLNFKRKLKFLKIKKTKNLKLNSKKIKNFRLRFLEKLRKRNLKSRNSEKKTSFKSLGRDKGLRLFGANRYLRTDDSRVDTINNENVIFNNNSDLEPKIEQEKVYDNCEINGEKINHNSGKIFYKSNLVDFGKSCEKENRVCNNGILSGNFTELSCSVEGGKSCLYTNEQRLIKDGIAKYFFNKDKVQGNDNCVNHRILKTCKNGSWFGDDEYVFSYCGGETIIISNNTDIKTNWVVEGTGPNYFESSRLKYKSNYPLFADYITKPYDIMLTGFTYRTDWKKGAISDQCISISRDHKDTPYGLYSGGYSDIFCMNINQLGSDGVWEKKYDLSQNPLYIPANTRIRCNPVGGHTEKTKGKRSCELNYRPYISGEKRYRVLRIPYFDLGVNPGQDFLPSFYVPSKKFPLKVKGFYFYDAAFDSTYTACLYGQSGKNRCISSTKMIDKNHYSPDFIKVDWVINPEDSLYGQCTISGNNPLRTDCAFYVIVEIPDSIPEGPENIFRDYGNINPLSLKNWCKTYVEDYIVYGQKLQLCGYDKVCANDPSLEKPIKRCIDSYKQAI